MSYHIKLRPELLHDVSDAFAWYQDRDEGLGYEFLRVFYAAIATAERDPKLFREVFFNFRRVLLRRFPYSLYYRLENETIIFFLLFHHARDPDALRTELRERKKNA